MQSDRPLIAFPIDFPNLRQVGRLMGLDIENPAGLQQHFLPAAAETELRASYGQIASQDFVIAGQPVYAVPMSKDLYSAVSLQSSANHIGANELAMALSDYGRGLHGDMGL